MGTEIWVAELLEIGLSKGKAVPMPLLPDEELVPPLPKSDES